MRVMRANLDGSKIETLVDTSQGEARPGKEILKWCVGIAIDVDGGKFYWTQKDPTMLAKAASSAPTLKSKMDKLQPLGRY